MRRCSIIKGATGIIIFPSFSFRQPHIYYIKSSEGGRKDLNEFLSAECLTFFALPPY
jgi:hypothetical protein